MFILIPEENLATQRMHGADALVWGEAQHGQGLCFMVQPWVFPGWLCHQPGWLEMEKELLCPNIFLSKIGSMLLDIKVCHFYQRKLVGGPYEEGFLCLVESFGEAHHGGSPARGSHAPLKQARAFRKVLEKTLSILFPSWRQEIKSH